MMRSCSTGCALNKKKRRRWQVHEGARCCSRVLSRSGGDWRGGGVALRCTGQRGMKAQAYGVRARCGMKGEVYSIME